MFVNRNTTAITAETAGRLKTLADLYETEDFLQQDPCRFPHCYEKTADRETAAFIAAMLAFGRRDQILSKVHYILQMADSSGMVPSEWIRSGKFLEDFPESEQKFYRFYSFTDIRIFFTELQGILAGSETAGSYFKKKYETIHNKKNAEQRISGTSNGISAENDPFLLQQLISAAFPKSRIVPKNRLSACKRIHMFLRWMVRTGSPVDLGLWTWYSPGDLIIPLDTHVLAESSKLGLLRKTCVPEESGSIPAEDSDPTSITAGTAVTAGTAKNAQLLTGILRQIWPADPCKGDFALFGLGINRHRGEQPD